MTAMRTLTAGPQGRGDPASEHRAETALALCRFPLRHSAVVRSESRCRTSRVAQGIGQAETVDSLDQRHGVSRETIRNQLKAVLTKTGLRGSKNSSACLPARQGEVRWSDLTRRGSDRHAIYLVEQFAGLASDRQGNPKMCLDRPTHARFPALFHSYIEHSADNIAP